MSGMINRWPATLAVAAALVSGARAPAQPTIVDIGVLPGAETSVAHRLGPEGERVVGVSGDRVFRWTAVDGFVDLGGPDGGGSVHSSDISVPGGLARGGAGRVLSAPAGPRS